MAGNGTTVFLTHPGFCLACIACTAASVGYSASLMLQQRLMALTPEELAGHALGLQSSGTLAMQGVGAALAGLVAERTGPGAAMAIMAAISVTVTLLLAPGRRSGARTTPVASTARASSLSSRVAYGPRAWQSAWDWARQPQP